MGGKRQNLVGLRFGKLVVECFNSVDKNKSIKWDCVCDCGGKTTVSSNKLRSGWTKSCGCLHGRGKGEVKADASWREDLSGKVFGRLTVVSFVHGDRLNRFACLCSCGNITYTSRQSLMRGTTVSCGCYKREAAHSRMKGEKNHRHKHGLTRKNPLWDKYHHMIGRCYRHKEKAYKTYGGRGIAVCRIWRKDIVKFVSWALQNGYSPGLEIDRINNNGPYSPWNCQFITSEQNKRKRHSQKGMYLPM